MGIILDAENRCHKITAPKRELRKMQQQVKDYYDKEKTIGFSRKKRKFVMKYPRRTFWKKYFMARPHLRGRKRRKRKI